MCFGEQAFDIKKSPKELQYKIHDNSYHSKADISLFEGRSIIGSVTRHCHHLSGSSHCAVNDA